MANADLICEMLVRALVLGKDDVPSSTHAPLCITEDYYCLDYDVIPSKKDKYERKLCNTPSPHREA